MPTPRRVRDDRRSAPLQVLDFAGRVLADTGRGMIRCWWQLLGLAALSFVLHHLLIDLGAQVAIDNGPAGMALLVLAIAVRLVLIAVMVLVAASHIQVRGRPLVSLDLARFVLDPDEVEPTTEPPRLREHLTTFVTALGPLVLLYAGWQLVNDDLHQFLVRLFDISLGTPEGTNNSNINFNEGWKSYIAWAVGIWVVKIILEQLRRWTGRRLLDLLIVYAEVAWIVLAWLVVTSIIGRARSWWREREVVSWWRQAIDYLTTIVPPDLDLPAVINTAAAAIGGVLSLLFFQLAQPIVWVAVVGLVLGWGLTESSLVQGSRIEKSVQRRWSDATGRQRFALDAATRGLREKYVPVLAMLRLMWRSGPLPVLTIAALYALGGLLGQWLQAGVSTLVNPHGDVGGMAAETVERCVRFLLEPVRVCFLVATFAGVLGLRAVRLKQVSAESDMPRPRRAATRS